MSFHAREYSPAEKLAMLPAEERRQVLSRLTDTQIQALQFDWEFWARPNQLWPRHDNWSNWLLLAGRGFGKTRCGAEWVRAAVTGNTPMSGGKFKRIGIVAETAADARDVLVEGDSGILAIHPKAFRPLYEPSKRRLTWPNGATGILFNATEPDQLRGPQFDAAWCDELAKWRYMRETWDMLAFANRLGTAPKTIITTTPRPVPLLRELLANPKTVTVKGSTRDNLANLAQTFIENVYNLYAGTRLGRQELEAEMLEDTPGALWTRDMLDHCRVRKVPDLQRVIVSIDPSGVRDESEENKDEIGIVVAGKTGENAFVLEDLSLRAGPAQWGAIAVNAYRRHKADAIVAETNFGGAMVEYVIKSIDPSVPVISVSASRGKWIRAEPVSALYAKQMVHHLGSFPELEDQMCLFNGTGYTGGGSPDRADALVWAITNLLLDAKFYRPRVTSFGY